MLKVGAARIALAALIACAAVAGATMERPVRPPKNAPTKAEKPIDPSWWLSDNAEAMAKEAGMELTPSDRQTLSEVRDAFQLDATKSAGPLAKLLNSPPLAKFTSAIDGWKRKECMKQLAKGAVATPAAFSLPPYDPDEAEAAQGAEGGPAVFDMKKDLPDDFEEKWKKGDYMFKG